MALVKYTLIIKAVGERTEYLDLVANLDREAKVEALGELADRSLTIEDAKLVKRVEHKRFIDVPPVVETSVISLY